MIENDENLPVIKARRVAAKRPGDCDLAVIDECPYCDKRHTHGWGSGHRLSHCADTFDGRGNIIRRGYDNPGYVLDCSDDDDGA